jgi:hypothetical protein
MVKFEFEPNFHLVRTLDIYMHARLLLVEHVLEHETVFSDSTPISQNCLPKFGAVPTRRAITLNPCIVCGIRGCCFVCIVEGFVLVCPVRRSVSHPDLRDKAGCVSYVRKKNITYNDQSV